MRKGMQFGMALGIVALLVGVPTWYAATRTKESRRFRVVEDGKLYRSGQLNREGLQRVINEYGVRTIVSLRYAERDDELPPDAAEEAWCRENGIHYVRIRPREWSGLNQEIPAERGVRQFLEVMDDPANHPVLIHCFAGIHRTGAHCALYRMEYQGWSSDEALREMRLVGYDNLDAEWDVRQYLSEYRRRNSTQASTNE